jgi:hypothetical protein
VFKSRNLITGKDVALKQMSMQKINEENLLEALKT